VQKITREVRHEAATWGELRDDAQRIQDALPAAQRNWVADDDAVALLKATLIYDHAKRVTAMEAMELPYFDAVRPGAAKGDVVERERGAAAAAPAPAGAASKRDAPSSKRDAAAK